MKVVAVANQKGGVGKTTITLQLAATLSGQGHRVLVIDADPQGSATVASGIDTENLTTVADLLSDAGAGHAVTEIAVPSSFGGDIAPADWSLSAWERDTELIAPELRLRDAIEVSDADAYDVVLVDCPPNLGRATLAALIASSGVLLVTEPAYLSLAGVSELLGTIARVRRHQPAVGLIGAVVNRAERTAEADQRLAELAEALGPDVIWQPILHRRTALAEAIADGRPVADLGSRGLGLQVAFEQLAAQLLTALDLEPEVTR